MHASNGFATFWSEALENPLFDTCVLRPGLVETLEQNRRELGTGFFLETQCFGGQML